MLLSVSVTAVCPGGGWEVGGGENCTMLSRVGRRVESSAATQRLESLTCWVARLLQSPPAWRSDQTNMTQTLDTSQI